MPKIEITDEMVERGIAAESVMRKSSRDRVRAVLDAALNPPPEPEIEVTEAMERAGTKAWMEWMQVPNPTGEVYGCAHVYRAMERQRRKDAKEQEN